MTPSPRRWNVRLDPVSTPLVSVDKAQVIDALPLRLRDRQPDFSTCQVCRRVFWEGSHWRHMRERLAKAVSAAAGERELHPGADSSIFR